MATASASSRGGGAFYNFLLKGKMAHSLKLLGAPAILLGAPSISLNIAMIPKCERPKSIHDLRPIALCNVLYNIFFPKLWQIG